MPWDARSGWTRARLVTWGRWSPKADSYPSSFFVVEGLLPEQRGVQSRPSLLALMRSSAVHEPIDLRTRRRLAAPPTTEIDRRRGEEPERRKGRATPMSFVRGLVSGSMMIGRLGGPRHATDAIAGSRTDAVASTATLDRTIVRASDDLWRDPRGIVQVEVDQDGRRDAGGRSVPILPRIGALTAQEPSLRSWLRPSRARSAAASRSDGFG